MKWSFFSSPRAIWLTLISLNTFILGTIKEMWTDWKWFKYEIYIPDFQEERREGLSQSKRRLEKVKSWRWISKEAAQERLDLIIKLRKQGLTLKKVAPQVRITYARVSQILGGK